MFRLPIFKSKWRSLSFHFAAYLVTMLFVLKLCQSDSDFAINDSPRIRYISPKFQTVNPGVTVTFRCEFVTPSPHVIRWLKRVTESPRSGRVKVLDDTYQMLSTHTTRAIGDNTYISTLTVDRVDETHAGSYICLVGNLISFQYETAILSLKDADTTTTTTDTSTTRTTSATPSPTTTAPTSRRAATIFTLTSVTPSTSSSATSGYMSAATTGRPTTTSERTQEYTTITPNPDETASATASITHKITTFLPISLTILTPGPHNAQTGQTVRLECRVEFDPKQQGVVQIKWMKEADNPKNGPGYLKLGNVMFSDVASEVNRASFAEPGSQNHRITFYDATVDASGYYACVVTSPTGMLHRMVYLDIEPSKSNYPSAPVILPGYPSNDTAVYLGQKTLLECRVRSISSPNIVWLKKINKPALKPRNSITRNSILMEVLKTSSVRYLGNDIYGSVYFFHNVTMDDAGVYLCMGVNSLGVGERYITLTVIEEGGGKQGFTAKRNDVSPTSKISQATNTTVSIASSSQPEPGDESLDVRLPQISPVFTHTSEIDWDGIIRSSGSLTLICKAFGVPPPVVTWYRESKPIKLNQFTRGNEDREKLNEIVESRRRGSLKLLGATEADSGTYTCKAANIFGAIRYTYDVIIKPLTVSPI